MELSKQIVDLSLNLFASTSTKRCYWHDFDSVFLLLTKQFDSICSTESVKSFLFSLGRQQVVYMDAISQRRPPKQSKNLGMHHCQSTIMGETKQASGVYLISQRNIETVYQPVRDPVQGTSVDLHSGLANAIKHPNCIMLTILSIDM